MLPLRHANATNFTDIPRENEIGYPVHSSVLLPISTISRQRCRRDSLVRSQSRVFCVLGDDEHLSYKAPHHTLRPVGCKPRYATHAPHITEVKLTERTTESPSIAFHLYSIIRTRTDNTAYSDLPIMMHHQRKSSSVSSSCRLRLLPTVSSEYPISTYTLRLSSSFSFESRVRADRRRIHPLHQPFVSDSDSFDSICNKTTFVKAASTRSTKHETSQTK